MTDAEERGKLKEGRTDIYAFPFSRPGLSELKNTVFGENWPVVYLLHDRHQLYVGESSSVFQRMQSHIAMKERRELEELNIIYDTRFNKSVILDLESLLIQLFAADGKFRLQNVNGGQDQKHNYYQRAQYEQVFHEIWNQLRERDLARQELEDLRNSDLFKFSPFHTLTTGQYEIFRELAEHIRQVLIEGTESDFTAFVSGSAGTGKTVLAVFLVRKLTEIFEKEGQDLKIGLVIAMTPLRQTLKTTFKEFPGLKASMVLSPADVTRKNWDILIVDEAHRLRQRRGLTSFGAFDAANARLGLDRETGTELDWVLKQSRIQILFYDPKQSIRPSDVPAARFEELKLKAGTEEFSLNSQMRVLAGESYIRYIRQIFSDHPPEAPVSFRETYEFGICAHLSDLLARIRSLDQVWGLSRIAAGYAWPWKTKGMKSHEEIAARGAFDFEIEGIPLIWNSTLSDWIGSPHAIDEVGCIHTLQGYDLNYAGILIGPDLTYDWNERRLKIRRDHYHDAKGKHPQETEEELREHILNIYQVLLTRGIRGTLIYVCDPDLKRYLSQYIPDATDAL